MKELTEKEVLEVSGGRPVYPSNAIGVEFICGFIEWICGD